MASLLATAACTQCTPVSTSKIAQNEFVEIKLCWDGLRTVTYLGDRAVIAAGRNYTVGVGVKPIETFSLRRKDSVDGQPTTASSPPALVSGCVAAAVVANSPIELGSTGSFCRDEELTQATCQKYPWTSGLGGVLYYLDGVVADNGMAARGGLGL